MMPRHYAYDLKSLAAQGSNPQQPVFTQPFAYRPQVTVMEAYEADDSSPPPPYASLAAAKEQASKIRDKKVTHPAGLEERTYSGVNYPYMPKSKQLSKDAENMNPAEVATYFEDFLTAEFYRGALRPNKRIEDSTIPKSAAGMKLHVDLLVRAFKSIEKCDDNLPMIKPFGERRHDSKLVECLCWNIVKACVFRSKSDEPLLTAYEPHKARNSPGLDTFEKRFDAIATAMTRSKTICKHLYDAPYINTFVDDPLRSIRRVDANRDLNKQKAGIMAKGKALAEQQGGPTKTAPPKKTRTGRKRTASEMAEGEEDTAQVQSPMNAYAAATHVVAPITPQGPQGRITRRMSRIMAEAQSSSSFDPPSSLRSQIISSPMSSEVDIKDESSPFHHQAYIMNGMNGAPAMSMRPNGFDSHLPQGIHFPSRLPPAMPMGYGPGMIARNGAYFNQMQLNYLIANENNNVPYRNGPMQPEEVTMAGSATQYASINPFVEEDPEEEHDE